MSIRKLSYLALDSLYTGVPFSLDLSSIFLSLGQYERQVFSGQSNFQNALDLLEGVVRNSVYMSPRSLLQESTCTEHALNFFESKDTGGDISPMRDLLEPSKENDRKLEDAVQSDEPYSNKNRFIVLNFDKEQPVKNPVFDDRDLVQWEKDRRKGAGKTYSRFGAAWDPTRKHLRVSAAVRSAGSKTEEEKVFRIAKEIAHSEENISDNMDLPEVKRSKNQINIIEFICRTMWGWERKYYFRGPIVRGHNPVYNSLGTTSLSYRVQNYKNTLETKEYDGYLIDEAKLLIDHLQDISYRGRTLCYAGSLVVGNQLDEDAEFDGATFFLGSEAENRRITLAEAKGGNRQNAADAENELWEKADELGMDLDRLEVDRYDRGAVMSVFES